MQNSICIFNNVHSHRTFNFLESFFQINERNAYSMDRELLLKFRPNLIIICTHVHNDESAFQLCLEVKRLLPSVPVVIVCDEYDEIQAVKFFEIQTDDYIVLPLKSREFISRIKSHIRKSHDHLTGSVKISFGNLDVFPNQHKVSIDGQEVNISNKEFTVLMCFINNQSTVLSREKILDMLESHTTSEKNRLVDVYISSLRKRLNLTFIEDRRKKSEFYIKTVKGHGYIFDSYE